MQDGLTACARPAKESMQIDSKTLLQNVRQTYAKAIGIVERKNRDYATEADPFANFRTATVLGLTVEKGILVRTLDKIMRVNNLLENPAYVTEESIEDTLVDAINYLALLKAHRELIGSARKADAVSGLSIRCED